MRHLSSTEYAVTSVVDVASGLAYEAHAEGGARGARGEDSSERFENDCKGSNGDGVLECTTRDDGNSGISSDIDTGRLAGICENVADVGENAAAAVRFEPDLGVGDDVSGFAEVL